MDSDLSWADQGKAIRLLCNSWSRGEAVVRPAWASDTAWGAFERMWPEMARTMSDAVATAKRNSEHAQKAARARWENAPSMPGALPEHPPGIPQSNHPNPNPNPKNKAKDIGRRGSRLPDDAVLTQEWREIAKRHGVADPERTFTEFKNYWTSLPGQKATKLDWRKTWENRCIEVAGRQRPTFTPPDRPNLRNSLAPVEARQNVPSYEETKRRLEAEDEERRRTLLLRQAREAAQA